MGKFQCDNVKLGKFICEFNPTQMKYLLSDVDDPTKEKVEIFVGKYQDTNNAAYWKISELEDTYLTIENVYGEDEKSKGWCSIVELASEKFLGEYVNIEGICQLFKSSYFYFEWMMHLEYNKDSHEYKYYRDHYVHQVRNMYEMFQFLDKLDFIDRCRHIYGSLDNEVGKLIRKSIEEEYHSQPGIEWKIWRELHLEEDAMKKLLYNYLFHASAIVASLLHDIGYPIAYIGRTVQHLGSFLPFTNLFVEEMNTMATIHSVLQDSLLYRITGQRKVAEQVERRDHGALSAVVLLYKYYDNGKIAGLSPIKKAIIELSAVMIYNHTMRFEDMIDKSCDCYKNVFRDNPMSYLFRLCDDLQEWDRNYFEITKHSNFFVCGNCLMPLTKDKDQEGKGGEKAYSCWCGDGKGINTTTFSYRRLINIEACDELSVETTSPNKMNIHVRYDKARLLQLVAYSPDYARMRAKGMREMKKMLHEQSEFPDAFLDFFISNNPIMIKAEIVADWFSRREGSEFISRLNKFIEDLCRKEVKEQRRILFDKLCQLQKSNFEQEYKADCEELEKWLKLNLPETSARNETPGSIDYIWKKFYFYYTLALIGQFLCHMNKENLIRANDGIAGIALKLRKNICQQFTISSREEKDLIENYFKHKMYQYDRKQFDAIKSEKEWEMYFDSFSISTSDRDVVRGYIANWEYEEIKKAARDRKDVPAYYDYYSDYYLYYSIAYKQQTECEGEEREI